MRKPTFLYLNKGKFDKLTVSTEYEQKTVEGLVNANWQSLQLLQLFEQRSYILFSCRKIRRIGLMRTSLSFTTLSFPTGDLDFYFKDNRRCKKKLNICCNYLYQKLRA